MQATQPYLLKVGPNHYAVREEDTEKVTKAERVANWIITCERMNLVGMGVGFGSCNPLAFIAAWFGGSVILGCLNSRERAFNKIVEDLQEQYKDALPQRNIDPQQIYDHRTQTVRCS